MKVTVCQLHDEVEAFAQDWEQLGAHIKAEQSDLVLLPEMPFHPWFARSPVFDLEVWRAAVDAHNTWQTQLHDFAPTTVLSSRPIDHSGRRYNEGFVWEPNGGYRAAHIKAYLPDEDGVWEASWYDKGVEDFTPIAIGPVQVGFAICTELWMMEQARRYGKAGVHVLVTPRMTEAATLDKWLAGGRVAAILAGAFSLSSNRVDRIGTYGGQGWIINPDGNVLGLTSYEQPFVTIELDFAEAEQAKTTYPRYAI